MVVLSAARRNHEPVPCSPTLSLQHAWESKVDLYRSVFPRPLVLFPSFAGLFCYLDTALGLVALGKTTAGVGSNCSSDEGGEINLSPHLSISSTIRADREMQRALQNTIYCYFQGW